MCLGGRRPKNKRRILRSVSKRQESRTDLIQDRGMLRSPRNPSRKCAVLQATPFRSVRQRSGWQGSRPNSSESLSMPRQSPLTIERQWRSQAPQTGRRHFPSRFIVVAGDGGFSARQDPRQKEGDTGKDDAGSATDQALSFWAIRASLARSQNSRSEVRPIAPALSSAPSASFILGRLAPRRRASSLWEK